MVGIDVSEDVHGELEDRKETIADVRGVDESEVTFDDTVRSFLYPESWNGVLRDD